MTVQPTDWVDAHLGWDTLIASFIVAGVTIVYVVLTWRLLVADRQSTNAALEANEVARQALGSDRQQYALALRNRQDSSMPAVTVQFTATAFHKRGNTPQETFAIGTVGRDEFNSLPLFLNSGFNVVNYGPGPALLWVEVSSSHDVRLTASHDNSVDLSREPTVIPPNSTAPVTIGVSVATDGYTVFEAIIGKPYAEVRFRWSGFSQRDIYDQTALTLEAGIQELASGNVDNSFLSRVFSQPPVLLLPEARTYPSSEEVAALDGSHRSSASVTSR